jgi:hypothetical protein
MEKEFMTLEEYELTDNQRVKIYCVKEITAALDRLTEAIKNTGK